jgi:uncharacterized membrane protein YczE
MPASLLALFVVLAFVLSPIPFGTVVGRIQTGSWLGWWRS